MGVSVRAKMPVMQMIGNRIGPSLFLMVTGLVLSVLIAIPLGVAAAFKPYSFLGQLLFHIGIHRKCNAELFPWFVCLIYFLGQTWNLPWVWYVYRRY